MKIRKWISLFLAQFLAATVCWAQVQRVPEFVWKQSLPIRGGGAQITAIGGTELRELVVFDKKLFAANGYWMDTEKGNPALPESAGAAAGRSGFAVAGGS